MIQVHYWSAKQEMKFSHIYTSWMQSVYQLCPNGEDVKIECAFTAKQCQCGVEIPADERTGFNFVISGETTRVHELQGPKYALVYLWLLLK
jgi:hypothetical protein